MSDPSHLARTSRSAGDGAFVRDAHPALDSFFAALDSLASPPPDVAVRRQHVSSAASIAAALASTGGSKGTNAPSWHTVGWRVAAVAAALAVVIGGLGADDRLPAPAQRMVSSIADAFGVDVPDGTTRSRGDEAPPGEPGGSQGQPGDVGRDVAPTSHDGQRPDDAPRATPAEPGEPGDPATPAIPPDPDKPDHPETPPQPEPRQAPNPPAPTSTPADTAPSTVPDQPGGAPDRNAPSNSPDGAEKSSDRGVDPPDDADGGQKSEKSSR